MQSALNKSGETEIDCAPLDELLVDFQPTYVKMDIEGAEPEALIGMQKILNKEPPILAISVYHRMDHLWALPLLIQSFSDQYHFFLRPHGAAVWDLVCYAVPSNLLKAI